MSYRPSTWEGIQPDGERVEIEWEFSSANPMRLTVDDHAGNGVEVVCSREMALGIVVAVTKFLFYEQSGPPTHVSVT